MLFLDKQPVALINHEKKAAAGRAWQLIQVSLMVRNEMEMRES